MDSELESCRSSVRAVLPWALGVALGGLVACALGCSAPGDSTARQGDPTPDAAMPKATPDGAAPTAAPAGRVTLTGNTHPLARSEFDLGPVDRDFALDHLQLVLKRSPEKAAALDARIDGLHDPGSPDYHHWLTAAEFGERFGPSAGDLDAVTAWLASNGMRVEDVPPGRMFVTFSASAAQVDSAFGTTIHRLNVDGERHVANMVDPTIPASLANVIEGVHALHDFMPRTFHRRSGPVRRQAGSWSRFPGQPHFTFNDPKNGPYYAVTPADFATIYGLTPLFSEGLRGAGQTIAVIEDTNLLNTSDVTTFRGAFGLSGYAGTFSQVHPSGATTCTNPGTNSAEDEAALDAEWAGATAPDATIELAACKDTTTVFGGLIAVQNLINGSSPPSILSISYGQCESVNGAAANASYVNTYQQAAAQGISVFVSSGDEGGAACDPTGAYATHGLAVSGFASTPYNVAVGGTDFMDTYDHAKGGPAVTTYWSATNTATYGSALSYVPEIPWNSTCASQLVLSLQGYANAYGASGYCNTSGASAGGLLSTTAGSGGPSAYSSQPAWQTGVVGLPTASAGRRYLPDVSLFAGNGVWSHYLIYCMTDTAQGGGPCTYTNVADTEALGSGGTSFAAPAMAGIQAIINQSAGSNQGNPNYELYKLAGAQYGAGGSTACNATGGTAFSPVLPSSSCIFNDVTQGDIDIPCRTTNGCYGASGSNDGVLSTSSSTLGVAYAAATGWDYATGLGSVNAYQLVHAWGGCDIGGKPYAAGAANPSNACQTCAPATSVASFTTTLADGTSCGTGKLCSGGTCVAGCIIGGTFHGSGSPNPGNACQACAPSTSTSAWSSVTDGTACNDGVSCTQSDHCTGGVCGGATYACTPGACQATSTCNGTGGCATTPKAAGTACTSDGNPCTTDACDAIGACTHASLTDGTPCGSGVFCSGGACLAGCVIGGTFYGSGVPDPGSACQVCAPSASTSAWASVADGTTCNDGVACTQNDQCTGGVCGGTAYACAPGVCQATSTCNGAGGCATTPKAAGGACTSDGNPCTIDACDVAGACTHTPVTDGTPCSGGTCVSAVCTSYAPEAGVSEAGASDGGVPQADAAQADAAQTDAAAADEDAAIREAGPESGSLPESGPVADGAPDAERDAAAANDGGTPEVDATDGAPGSTEAGGPESARTSQPSGCGCRTAGRSSDPLPAAWLASFGAALGIARRRRSISRHR
ncbi:MAG: protease pro-enzyme activation domain-containing protein [Polyangiaceae bacterium]